MFYLEENRHQLIIEVKLPDAAVAEYKKEKEADPTGSTFFTLETQEDLALAELVAEKKPFKASIIKKNAPEKCVSPSPLHRPSSLGCFVSTKSCTQNDDSHRRSRILDCGCQRSLP